MANQSLILNIIPFKAPKTERDFTFYTTKQDSYCPIHKGDLRGIIEELIDESELDEGSWLYTDFQQAKKVQ